MEGIKHNLALRTHLRKVLQSNVSPKLYRYSSRIYLGKITYIQYRSFDLLGFIVSRFSKSTVKATSYVTTHGDNLNHLAGDKFQQASRHIATHTDVTSRVLFIIKINQCEQLWVSPWRSATVADALLLTRLVTATKQIHKRQLPNTLRGKA